jgi:transposase-like protein
MDKEYRTLKRNQKGKVREISKESVLLSVPMAEILNITRGAVETLAEELGIMLMLTAMSAEAEDKAGVKHRKDPLRKINWWGEQKGYVCYEDKKIPVIKPRLRHKDTEKEVELDTYKAFQSIENKKRLCMGDLLNGLTCRKYERVAERFLDGYGIKKSSVSRTYIKATKAEIQKLMERQLNKLDLFAIFIDGIAFKEHMLVVAIGIDTDGNKHLLGLWQGATENYEVCKGLLDDIERRGLDCNKDYLFVMDGSKSLRKSVAMKFGNRGIVQRCQFHKRQNIKGHLPKKHQSTVDRMICAAYKMSSYQDAKASLETVIKYLEKLNPSAASSLKEGLEETLTVHKLGIGTLLRKTLSSTNVIESCFSTTRTVTNRVKRWRNDDMVERWACVALLEAEKRFKRIKGYKDIPKLLLTLKRDVTKNNLTNLGDVA